MSKETINRCDICNSKVDNFLGSFEDFEMYFGPKGDLPQKIDFCPSCSRLMLDLIKKLRIQMKK